MRNIQSELERAGADFRQAGQTLPDRHWDKASSRWSSGGPLRVVAVAAAVVFLLAVPIAFFGGGSDAGGPAATGDAIEVPVSVSGDVVETTIEQPSESPPYLLLGADGWQMVSYSEGASPRTLRNSLYEGPNGAHAEVSIWSGTAGDVDLRAETWLEEVATSVRPVTIDGIDAVATNLDDVGSRVMVVGGTDSYVIEIDYQSSDGVSNTDSDALLSEIHFVELAAFEAAMPPGSVTSATRDTVVAEILADIPQPTGFDVSNITATGDRYYVGADVVSAVTCGWIEQWSEARASGDSIAEAEAVDAMQSSKNWAILLEMDAEGDYPEIVWGYADGMAGDGTLSGSNDTPVEDGARLGIGCN